MSLLKEKSKTGLIREGQTKITVVVTTAQHEKLQHLRGKARKLGLVVNFAEAIREFLDSFNSQLETELKEKQFNPRRHVLPGLGE